MTAPRRILLTAITVTLVVLWVRSYVPPTVHVRSHDGRVLLFFSDGRLPFVEPDAPDYRGSDTMYSVLLGDTSTDTRLMGFAFIRGLWPRPVSEQTGGFVLRPYTLIAVPYWALTAATGIPAAVALLRHRRSRRWKRSGRCAGCGFDVRFSKERCPECGMELDPSAAQEHDGMSPPSR